MKEHLFVSSTDGNLYDTRAADWSSKPALRPRFSWHFREITTPAEFKACLRAGAYAWPGGYPLYFVMADGESLSFESARENMREIMTAIQTGGPRDDWRPVGIEVNYEDSDMVCAHSGKPIPAAYSDKEKSKDDYSDAGFPEEKDLNLDKPE